MNFNRRRFLHGLAAVATTSIVPTRSFSQAAAASDRVAGMLMGSLIGDALGGPVEFMDPQQSRHVLANARDWDDNRVLNDRVLSELAESLTMHSYAQLRPETAAYGPWLKQAAAGTITDDSRHKIILMRALEKRVAQRRTGITAEDLAREFIDFQPHRDRPPEPELVALVEEGLREYRYAARWILGQRQDAYPVERLWAGVSNCSGQMALLPLAGIFAGDPHRAYLETFQLDFMDAPIARDICAALNAGLAAALDPARDTASTDERWNAMLSAFQTDPYDFKKVPFAGRQLDRWLALSDSIVERAQGRPAAIYRLLEQEGKPVYYWDAHFTLLVPLTMLKACRFEPLAAMHLTLDFGHDSDSYGQVLGAMAGAVHGIDLFPDAMVSAVATRLQADYGESVDHWKATLSAAASHWIDDTGR